MIRKQNTVAPLRLRPADRAPPLANHELVVIALYLARGDSQYVDTEDIAIKANELAPGRFAWRKYPDQINIDTVRKRLWDARRSEKGALVVGSEREGWMLTPSGVRFAKRYASIAAAGNGPQRRHSLQERRWLREERARLLASDAYAKLQTTGIAGVSQHEAEAFFRLNDYIQGRSRAGKIARLVNAFGDDPELGVAVKALASMVRAG
jgi:hypothetical protein